MSESTNRRITELEDLVRHMNIQMAAQNMIFYAVTMKSMLGSEDPESFLISLKEFADEVYDKAKKLPMADQMQAQLDQMFADLQLGLNQSRK